MVDLNISCPMTPGRRQFLQQVVVGAGAAAFTLGPSGPAWSQTPRSRLVVVFLRGAYDGLSAFVPYADPYYSRLRPNIAIAAPGSGEGAALALDAQFGLHPALAPTGRTGLCPGRRVSRRNPLAL